MLKQLLIPTLFISFLGFSATPEELAQESELAAAASAKKEKATPQLIMKKVHEATELLKKEGKEAFKKFKGKDSPFIFAGTYIWCHTLKDGIMTMHPIKHQMEGKVLLTLKDANGKLMFVEMNKIASQKGEGWIEYTWPKPGHKTPEPKVSYVKLVKIEGVDHVCGAGVYDTTLSEVEKILKNP